MSNVPVRLHPPTSLTDALEHWVRHTPMQAALVTAAETLSFESLLGRARDLAAGFCSVGVGAGSVICLQLPVSQAFVLALVGIEQLGAVAAPMPVKLIAYGVERFVSMVRPAAVCCPAPTEELDCCDLIEELASSAVPIHHRIVDGEPPNMLWNNFESLQRHGAFAREHTLITLRPPEEDAPLVLRPPLAPELQEHVLAMSVANISREGCQLAKMLSLEPGDRLLSLVEPSNPIGLSALVAGLSAGATLIVGSPTSDQARKASALVVTCEQAHELLERRPPALMAAKLQVLLLSDGSLEPGDVARVRECWPECRVT